MVRIIKYCCLILMLTINQAAAQEEQPQKSFEAYLSYGSNLLPFSINEENSFKRTPQWPINFRETGLPNVNNGKVSFLTSTGGVTLGISKHLSRHRIGGLFYYESQLMSQKTNFSSLDLGTGITTFIGLISFSDSRIQNFGVALRYDFHWVNHHKFQLYSGVSGGVYLRSSRTTYYEVSQFQDRFEETFEDFLRYKDSEIFPLVHINVLGIKYSDKWTVLLDSGLGQSRLSKYWRQ